MQFSHYEDAAKTTAQYPGVGTGKFLALSYVVLGLASESGEIAGKLKKLIRDDAGVMSEERRQQMIDELGDVLWYVAMTAGELGVSLHDIAVRNVMKLQDRHSRNAITGDGDNR